MNVRASPLPDSVIERVLEPALGQWLGHEIRIVAVRQEPYPYGSSHALESLDVELADGRTIALLLKHTEQDAGASHPVRPPFVDDPQREAEVYREVLGPCGINAPACICTLAGSASSLDATSDRSWLVLERVNGLELYQCGDFEAWLGAARWLARLHARFSSNGGDAAHAAPDLLCLRRATRLLLRDADFHRHWWHRAEELARARTDTEAVAAFARIRPRFDLAVERSVALPTTFIHGEFYAANILLTPGPDGPGICPVDWEMASLGPGLLDLAALSAGRWAPAQRDAMANTYHDALPAELQMPTAEFRTALADCRMLLAVQWLGWAGDWDPPPEQAHDWMEELISIAILP